MASLSGIKTALTFHYSPAFLLGELYEQVSIQPRYYDYFASKQIEQFNAICPKQLQCEFLVVDLIDTTKEGHPSGNLVGGGTRATAGLKEAYVPYADYDIFTPYPLVHQGNALRLSDFQSLEAWSNEYIWKKVCTHFDLGDIACISFPIPYQTHKALTFHYMRETGKVFPQGFTHDHFFQFSLPYYFCWLYRFGFIDQLVLKENLQLITNLTAGQIKALRVACSCETNSKADLAYHYGGQYGSFKKQLDRVHEAKIASLYSAKERKERNALADILKTYHLMKFTGMADNQLYENLTVQRRAREKKSLLIGEELGIG